jgi:CheY-like chemotaxis protein
MITTLGSILVAEDDASIADVIVEILTDEGYAVQSVTTGPIWR